MASLPLTAPTLTAKTEDEAGAWATRGLQPLLLIMPFYKVSAREAGTRISSLP